MTKKSNEATLQTTSIGFFKLSEFSSMADKLYFIGICRLLPKNLLVYEIFPPLEIHIL